jgi:hypothetical protein
LDYRLSIEARILLDYEAGEGGLYPAYYPRRSDDALHYYRCHPCFEGSFRETPSRFEKHRRITRWLWWVWMFVSLSGIAVYLMLYKL